MFRAGFPRLLDAIQGTSIRGAQFAGVSKVIYSAGENRSVLIDSMGLSRGVLEGDLMAAMIGSINVDVRGRAKM